MTTAIVPILLLLTGGAVLRRYVLRDEGFWRGLSWLSYWVFTPALFITAIGEADLSTVQPVPLIVSLAVPIVAVAALSYGLGRLTRANGPQLTSMVQGAIRINTYVGLIFAAALHGQPGVATFAIASALVVPLVNLISVTALSIHGDKGDAVTRTPLWRDIAANPLILACALGLAINALSLPLPPVVSSTLDLLSAPALACGTLIAGAALRFTFQRRDLLDISIAVVLKLVVLPLAAMAIALAFDVPVVALTIIVLIVALPTAPSSTVLAARMGGDTRLMSSITGIQTVISAASIPLVLGLAERLYE